MLRLSTQWKEAEDWWIYSASWFPPLSEAEFEDWVVADGTSQVFCRGEGIYRTATHPDSENKWSSTWEEKSVDLNYKKPRKWGLMALWELFELALQHIINEVDSLRGNCSLSQNAHLQWWDWVHAVTASRDGTVSPLIDTAVLYTNLRLSSLGNYHVVGLTRKMTH